MRKLIPIFALIFTSFIYLLSPFFINKPAQALFCDRNKPAVTFSFDFTPPLVQSDNQITVTVKPSGNLTKGSYQLQIADNNNKILVEKIGPGAIHTKEYSGNGDLIFNDVGLDDGKFELGTAQIALIGPDNKLICMESFEVTTDEDASEKTCSIEFITLDNKIEIKVNGLLGEGANSRGVTLRKADDKGNSVGEDLVNDCKSNDSLRAGIKVEKTNRSSWNSGYYTVKVTESCEPFFNSARGVPICNSPILVLLDPDEPKVIGPVADGATGSREPLSQPCSSSSENYSSKKGCLKIRTAIGDVNTQADDFIRWVLGFVLGISGGIVLIIIIISGYRLMTSQGDPEKVKNARDQLTSAAVGLLFIIFSLVILQLITRDILKLPGFGS